MANDHKLIQVVSCGCCVYRVKADHTIEVLLVRPFEDRDAWGVPKGHKEEGEDDVSCAVRETIEETGIVPKIIKPLTPVSTKYRNEIKFVRVFLAKPIDPDMSPAKMDEENFDVRYFPIDRLPRLHRYQASLLVEAATAIRELEG